MTDIIKNLQAGKAANDAKIKQLEHEIFLLKIENKKLDKAIKALDDGQLQKLQ